MRPDATAGRVYMPRSASNAATWARSSGTPSPVWAEVKNTFGVGGGPLAQGFERRGDERRLVGRLHLVALGQHDGVGDGGLVERRHRRFVAVLDPAPSVDQHEGAHQRRAAAQIVADQADPGGGFRLADRGVAVARHVDQGQPVAEREEDQLLGSPGRVRRARQRRAAGQRVDQRRLADVGAAGEGDLRRADRRQAVGLGGGEEEIAGPGEQLAPGLDRLRREVGVEAGGHVGLRRGARASSDCPTAPPSRRRVDMMSDCWTTVSVLFQVQ